MSFTGFNINLEYTNQLIKFSKYGGSTFPDIAFPAGVWNYVSINQHIREATNDGDDTTFRVSLTLKQYINLI